MGDGRPRRERRRSEEEQRRDGKRQRPGCDEAPVAGREEAQRREPPVGGGVDEVPRSRDELVESAHRRITGPALAGDREIGGCASGQPAQPQHAGGGRAPPAPPPRTDQAPPPPPHTTPPPPNNRHGARR